MIFPDPIKISLGNQSVSKVYMGPTLVWPIGVPMAINFERTTIYTVSSDIAVWASNNGVASPILTWQISSATTGGFVDVPSLSTSTAYLSGTRSSVNLASILPIRARLKARAGTTDYISTNHVWLRPYTDPTDIPKLQFWMDMSDGSTINTSPVLTQDWCWKFTPNNYVTIDNPINLFFSKYDFGVNDFTIESWIYLTQNNKNNIIFTNEESSTEESLVFYVSNQNKLVASVSENGTSYFLTVSSASTVPLQQWTHVAFTRQGNTYRVFVNGQETANSSSSPFLNNVAPFNPSVWFIGARPWNSQYFNGFISNFRISLDNCLYSVDFGSSLPTIPLAPTTSDIYLFTDSHILKNHADSDTVNVVGTTPPCPVNPSLGLVDSINDKSGNGFVASQTNFNNKGVYLSADAGINGLGVTQFDGLSSFYTLNKNLSVNTITGPQSAFSHFFVYERNASTINNTSLGVNNLTADSLFWHGTDNIIRSSLRQTAAITSLASIEIAGIVRNTLAVTDQASNTFTTAWGTTATKNNFANQLGRYQTNTYNTGSIGEIFHAGIALPLAEVRAVNSVLNTKWMGVTVSPTLLTAPYVFVISNTTLSTTTGTWTQYPTTSIQWQESLDGVNYSDIAGATSTTYVPNADDRELFIRSGVTATNSAGVLGPVYSNALQLVTYRNNDPLIQQENDFYVYVPNYLNWTSTMPITGYSFEWQLKGSSTNNQWETVFGSDVASSASWDFTPYDYSAYLPTVVTSVSAFRTSIFGVSAIPGTWQSGLNWPIDVNYQWQVNLGSTWQDINSNSTFFVYLSDYNAGANVRLQEQAYYRKPLKLDTNGHYVRVKITAYTSIGSYESNYSNTLYMQTNPNTSFTSNPFIIENEQRIV